MGTHEQPETSQMRKGQYFPQPLLIRVQPKPEERAQTSEGTDVDQTAEVNLTSSSSNKPNVEKVMHWYIFF